MRSWAPRLLLALALLALAAPGRVHADGIIDIGENSVPPFDAGTYPVLFPNWRTTPVSSFWVWECDDTTCTTCTSAAFTGITIVNLGTASGGAAGDITGVYWDYECGAGGTAVTALTYAGVWGGVPAWTWAGSIAFPNDACTICACFGSLTCMRISGRARGTGTPSPSRRGTTGS